ncbi:hypothetical protein HMPREF9120_02574 [Neisseria sp. oral taxon 020 str. F0370]|nr:hypothetical protein HMPREF9120_02574 [Neisseria sp. oral taxon 020 str. F0370]
MRPSEKALGQFQTACERARLCLMRRQIQNGRRRFVNAKECRLSAQYAVCLYAI